MATNSASGLAALPYTVIRIRAGDRLNPSAVHTGTGFLYALVDKQTTVPLIVSNKHVLCNKSWIEFDFASANDEGDRVFGTPTVFRINTGQLPILEHPDKFCDLAAVPLNPIIEGLRQNGQNPHTLVLSSGNLPPKYIQEALHAATSVLMIGFPNGLMDETNNLPIVRRGILATHYRADYLGQKNFVVDIAAFGGSSGSPVFAFFESSMPTADGGTQILMEPQTFLIGVLHSGPQLTAQGQIVPMPVPTGHFVAQTDLMIHLGYCLKAHRIEELAPVVAPYLVA